MLRYTISLLEPVSKISSASADEMRATTSSNLSKKSSVHLSEYTSGCFPRFPRFPRLASRLFDFATKLFLGSTLLALCVLGALPANAQDVIGATPRLIQDLNPCQIGLDQRSHVRSGDTFFFSQPLYNNDAHFGVMSPAGIRYIRINGISPSSSGVRFLSAINRVAYFIMTINNESLGFIHHLWRTDGTDSGTYLVKELGSGPTRERMSQLYPLGSGSFFFTLEANKHEVQLWVTNGTSEGTRPLEPTFSTSFAPKILSQSGLLTARPIGSNDTALYRLTPALTLERLDSVLPPKASWSARTLTPLNADLVFLSVETRERGTELWVTNGTPSGTRFVKDFVPGASSPQSIKGSTVRGSRAYFLVHEGNGGAALWESDGTPDGTRLFYTLDPDRKFENINSLTPTGKGVVFLADTKDARGTLWFSDGTVDGTRPITDPQPATVPTIISAGALARNNQALTLLVLRTPSTGYELFVTDGTPSGTILLRDHIPGPESGGPQFYPDTVDGKVFYLSFVPGGQALFETDGTIDGTRLVQRTGLGITQSSSVRSMMALKGSQVIFNAMIGCAKVAQLFSMDTSTLQIQPITEGPQATDPSLLVYPIGATPRGIFFVNNTISLGPELWFTDGTSAGTRITRDINPSPFNGSIYSQTPSVALGDKLFFFATDGVYGLEPHISDGTSSGTIRLGDLYAGPSGSLLSSAVVSTGDRAIFDAISEKDRAQIWSTDGTATGLTLLYERTDSPSSGLFLTPFRNRAVFIPRGGANNTEVWITDGTREGTSLLVDLTPLTTATRNPLQSVGDKLLISVTKPDGLEHILTDGTPAGTVMVTMPPLYGKLGAHPLSLFSRFGTKALMRISLPAFGDELWSLDTNSGELNLLRDISPGPSGSQPLSPVPAGSGVFFTASADSRNGRTWVTAGTSADTQEVVRTETQPPALWSMPLFANGQLLITSQYTHETGEEPYFISRQDMCPKDPYKFAPGACGCGVLDLDTDRDGTADCQDGCVADPMKTTPGLCGCGLVDAGMDLAGRNKCLKEDFCPADPFKVTPGVCGCGVVDIDKNGDGFIDCVLKQKLLSRLQEAIVRLKALRVHNKGDRSHATLRKLQKVVKKEAASVQQLLNDIRVASPTALPPLTKRVRQSLYDARHAARRMQRTMTTIEKAKLVKALQRLTVLLR